MLIIMYDIIVNLCYRSRESEKQPMRTSDCAPPINVNIVMFWSVIIAYMRSHVQCTIFCSMYTWTWYVYAVLLFDNNKKLSMETCVRVCVAVKYRCNEQLYPPPPPCFCIVIPRKTMRRFRCCRLQFFDLLLTKISFNNSFLSASSNNCLSLQLFLFRLARRRRGYSSA